MTEPANNTADEQQPAADPGNCDPAQLTEPLDPDDDVFDRIAAEDLSDEDDPGDPDETDPDETDPDETGAGR